MMAKECAHAGRSIRAQKLGAGEVGAQLVVLQIVDELGEVLRRSTGGQA